MMRRASRVAVLAACVLLFAAAAQGAQGADAAKAADAAAPTDRSAQLSSSVLLFYDSEFEPHYGQPISQCERLLNNARDIGASNSVVIVPTLYWMTEAAARAFPNPDGCYPENWITPLKVDYYCSRWEWDAPCAAMTPATIDRFRKGFTDCLQKAHDRFDEVVITPHIDHAAKTNHWRNVLDFDPLAKDRNGVSYWDFMVAPILDAVNAVYTQPGKTVVFSPQGEMGRTVFMYPTSWQTIIDRIKGGYKGPSRLNTMLGFNHAFLPGVVNRAGIDPLGTRALPPRPPSFSAFSPLLPLDKWPEAGRIKAAAPAFVRLLEGLDVLGVSCYPRAGPEPTPQDIESCADQYSEELAAVGFNLKAWLANPSKRFIFNEIGLGGGIHRCGRVPAKTRADAGIFPTMDVGYPWTAATDPWSQPDLRAYRRDWHGAALRLLSAGGLRYRVAGAYIWSIVSMDPQGIHPATTAPDGSGSFKDPVLAGTIKQHNEAVASARKKAKAKV